MDSIEMRNLVAERNETPEFVAAGSGSGADSPELFRFADGTEVIVTNAGLVTEDADGFAELRSEIV
jgi:hypothetical protein